MIQNKHPWLSLAEIIDSFRVFPRLFLLSCFIWTVWVSNQLLVWYTHLSKDDRSIEASGFASVVFLTIFGFLKLVYDQYSRTSRDWSAASSSVTASTTTITAETKP